MISYWENKPEIANCLKIIISRAVALLDKFLTREFSFLDATRFTSWKIETFEVHVCNRIATETIYSVGVSFKTDSVKSPTEEAVPDGEGELLADAWYDERKTIQLLFEKGYEPLICPNRRRSRGYYRKKSGELYKQRRGIYRQRGRGESLFRSMTNEFGNRFKVMNETSMQTRILARMISYQIKLLIRCSDKIISIDVLIIKHAHTNNNFKYTLF